MRVRLCACLRTGATYLSGRVLVLIIPEFCFQDFSGHCLDVFLGIVLGDGGEDKDAFADRGDELAVNGHGRRLDALENGWVKESIPSSSIAGPDMSTYSS